MPPDPPRRVPKIFLGAERLEKFWGPASHPPWQNPGSAPVVPPQLSHFLCKKCFNSCFNCFSVYFSKEFVLFLIPFWIIWTQYQNLHFAVPSNVRYRWFITQLAKLSAYLAFIDAYWVSYFGEKYLWKRKSKEKIQFDFIRSLKMWHCWNS